MKEGARYESSEPAAAPGPAWAAPHPSGLAPSPQRPLVSSLSSRQPGQVPGGGHGQGIWAGPEPGSGGLRRSQQLSAPNGGPWENQTSGLPTALQGWPAPGERTEAHGTSPEPLPVGWTSTGQHPGSGAGFSRRQLSDLGKTLGPWALSSVTYTMQLVPTAFLQDVWTEEVFAECKECAREQTDAQVHHYNLTSPGVRERTTRSL